MADNRIAYGMLKQAGINTDGMSPTEAWKKLNELKDVAAKKGYAVAHKVDFTANNVVSLNAYVDTLQKLFKQYNIGKIKSISTLDVIENNPDILGARSSNGIILKNSILDNPEEHYSEYVENFQSGIAKSIAITQSELSKTPASDVDKINKLQTKIRSYRAMQPYSRNNVCYKDCVVECAAVHEFAHELFDHLDDDKKELIKNRFDMFKNTSLFKKISYYASTNHQDFFAEIFVLKNMNKEPIPKPISDIFSELGV